MIAQTRPQPRDVFETAAAWSLEAERGLGPDRAAELDLWLAAAPEHAAAFEAARAALDLAGSSAAAPEVMDLRRQALAARREPASGRRIAAGLALAILAGGGLWYAQGRPGDAAGPQIAQATQRHATATGERSTITLADGTRVTLNTATTVEVAYGEGERGVRLIEGQALFDVAHGDARPFRVYAADQVVTATGTVFEVRLQGEAVRVALLSGQVRIARRDAAAPANVLSPGDLLSSDGRGGATVRTADVERLTTWRSGLVDFEDAPLSEAVAEINRYSTRKLVLDGVAAEELRLSGAFRTGDPERFARAMTEIFPLRLDHDGEGRLRLSPAAP